MRAVRPTALGPQDQAPVWLSAQGDVEARGRPDLFDLFVAFASGMVAAYAQGRPNVSGTLAGVAIAAALLPPLAVVGIAIMAEEIRIARRDLGTLAERLRRDLSLSWWQD